MANIQQESLNTINLSELLPIDDGEENSAPAPKRIRITPSVVADMSSANAIKHDDPLNPNLSQVKLRADVPVRLEPQHSLTLAEFFAEIPDRDSFYALARDQPSEMWNCFYLLFINGYVMKYPNDGKIAFIEELCSLILAHGSVAANMVRPINESFSIASGRISQDILQRKTAKLFAMLSKYKSPEATAATGTSTKGKNTGKAGGGSSGVVTKEIATSDEPDTSEEAVLWREINSQMPLYENLFKVYLNLGKYMTNFTTIENIQVTSVAPSSIKLTKELRPTPCIVLNFAKPIAAKLMIQATKSQEIYNTTNDVSTTFVNWLQENLKAPNAMQYYNNWYVSKLKTFTCRQMLSIDDNEAAHAVTNEMIKDGHMWVFLNQVFLVFDSTSNYWSLRSYPVKLVDGNIGFNFYRRSNVQQRIVTDGKTHTN